MTERGGKRLPAVVWNDDCVDERPKSYAVQDGCHNCNLVFVKTEYDGGAMYFCLKDAVHPRPPCLSVSMGEWHSNYHDIHGWLSERYYDNRAVYPWGNCKGWEEEVDE